MTKRLSPSLLVFGLLAACSTAARINQHVHDLNTVARAAAARHEAECAAPHTAVGVRPERPAVCAPLTDCLQHADQASRTCTAALQQLAQSGQGDDALCSTAHAAALSVCRAVPPAVKAPAVAPPAASAPQGPAGPAAARREGSDAGR